MPKNILRLVAIVIIVTNRDYFKNNAPVNNYKNSDTLNKYTR